jgi:hypothetical protein
MLASGFLAAAGYLLFAHTAVSVSRLLAPGPMATAMRQAFLLGAVIPAIEFLDAVGTLGTADYVSQWTLSAEALRALEISFALSMAKTAWLFSLESLFISAGMLIAAFAGQQQVRGGGAQAAGGGGLRTALPAGLCRMGIAAGVIGVILFALEVSQVAGAHGPRAGYALALFAWSFVLVPAYIIYASMIVGRPDALPFSHAYTDPREMGQPLAVIAQQRAPEEGEAL